MIKKLFLSSCTAAVLSFAYSSFSVMPYETYIKYSNKSVKNKALLGGLYLSYYNYPIKIELDGEYLKIAYKENVPSWDQKDLTLKSSYLLGNHWIFNAGIHNIWSKQYEDKFKYNKVLFGGIDYYNYLVYNIGIDYYYTNYKDFNVYQISPKIGINFGDYYSFLGSFYLEEKYNYIHISEENIAPKNHYNNFDIKLQNFNGPFTTELSASLGRFAYKIDKDGFVVYNTGDEYKYNYGLSINCNFQETNNIKIGILRSKFKNSGNDVFSTSFTVSFLKTF
jgi:hypothetical protein